jgi:hypothetical protein
MTVALFQCLEERGSAAVIDRRYKERRETEFVQQKSSREHAREDFAIRNRKGFRD